MVEASEIPPSAVDAVPLKVYTASITSNVEVILIFPRNVLI